MLKHVWDFVNHICAMFEDWMRSTFISIGFMDEIKRLQKQLKSQPMKAKEWPVYRGLDDRVSNMSKSLPLCAELRTPAMRSSLGDTSSDSEARGAESIQGLHATEAHCRGGVQHCRKGTKGVDHRAQSVEDCRWVGEDELPIRAQREVEHHSTEFCGQHRRAARGGQQQLAKHAFGSLRRVLSD